MSLGRIAVLGLLLLLLGACGSGGGGGGISLTTPDYTPHNGGGSGSSSVAAGATGSNVAALTVDGGVSDYVLYTNAAYTTVRVCAPGTSNCVTVDHVLVDTGSSGLRLMNPALLGLGSALPAVQGGNQPYGECASFVSTSMWGTVRAADVYVGGEEASDVPIQVVGDPAYDAPTSCGDGGASLTDDANSTGFNGIIGIGNFAHDCDAYCVTNTDNGNYFLCTSGSPDSCVSANAALSVQVVNPVTQFAGDNNGTVIELPTVPAAGAATASGTLIFGIGTRSNNGLGDATPLFVDADGFETTTYRGVAYTSYVDSGTSVLEVQDDTLTPCDYYTAGYGYECPATTTEGTAILSGTNTGVDAFASFSVANATTLFDDNPTYTAFPELAGAPGSSYFVWGEPFFYGRPVFTSIEGQSVSGEGTAPFVAF